MEWFEYLAKASLVLAVVYLTYWLLFRYDTFHRLKRWVLLAGLVLSTGLPPVQIAAFQTPVVIDSSQAMAIPVEYWLLMRQSVVEASHEEFSWQQIGLIAYGIVAGTLLLRLAFNLIKLFLILKRNHFQRESDYQLAEGEQVQTPFSFFRYILLPKMADAELRQQILAHEYAHASQYHTVDVLLSELYLVFFWFNPVAWLYRWQVRLNLEYLADAAVLQSADEYTYQMSLLKISTVTSQFTLVNHFHFSSLKHRIHMINRSASARWTYLKYMTLPMIITVLVSLFHITEAHNVVEKAWEPLSNIISEKASNHSEPSVNATVPVKNSISEKRKTRLIRGVIKDVDTGKPLAGVSVIAMKSADEKLYGMITDREGRFKLSLEDNDKIIYEHKDYLTPQLMQLAKNTPDELTVWLKMKPALQVDTDASLDGPRQSFVFQDSLRIEKVLFIVDGKKQAADERKKLDPNLIASMTVLKGKEATKLYGAEGENGVIIITTKSAQTPSPLYIIDGKESTKAEADKLDPNTIESMNVLKDKSATDIYGDKGKNGVIEIKLKK